MVEGWPLATLARNTAWLTVAKTLSLSVYAIFGLLLPRLVSMETNGVYTLMSTLLFFGSAVATIGVPTILVRTIAREPNQAGQVYADARRTLLLGSFVAGFCVLAYLLVEMTFQGGLGIERCVLGFLVCGIIFGEAFGSLGEALFQANEEMAVPAAWDVGTGLFRVGFAGCALYFAPHWGLFGVFTSFLIGSFIRGFVLPIKAEARFLPNGLPKSNNKRTKALMLESLGLALFQALRMLRNRLDSLLLGLLIIPIVGLSLLETSDIARGLYGQGMRVLFVFHALTMALNSAVFPRLTRLSAESLVDPDSEVEVKHQFGRVLRYQAWWAAPLAVSVFIWADPIAGWFGEQYRYGVEGLVGTTGGVLEILSIVVLLDCIGGPVGMLMIGRKEMDRKLPFFGLVFAVSSIVLNILFIPKWGILGAAWASFGAALVEVLVKIVLTKRLLGTAKLMAGSLPYIVLSVGISFALIKVFPTLLESPLLGSSLFICAYIIVSGSFGLIDSGITDRLRRLSHG